MKLKELIANYLALRRALSPGFDALEQMLNAFCRAMGEEVEITEITPEQVSAFLTGVGPPSLYWRNKYHALSVFYRYAVGRGYATSVEPQPRPSLTPYIYTPDELSRLLRATSTYRRSHRVLEPYTFRALLLLLYGAGLRVSEALALNLADVDLAAALITIRQTKFDKTRLVALGPELNQALAQYLAMRRSSSDVTANASLVGRLKGPSRRCASLRGSVGLMARAISHVCMTSGTPSLSIA
jgi:integrase/recombinase XerD